MLTESLPPAAPRRRLALLLLVAIGVGIYVVNASRPPLLDDADSCHALASVAMLQQHDWAVLHINGVRWLEKPPLHYWLVAASYLLFGQNAFATRLPLALSVIGLMLMLYEFGRRFFDERAGFYAALVIGTSFGVFLFTRIMIPEALYSLEFTAGFYLFLRAWTGSLSPRAGYLGFAALTGLAIITRAAIGVAFPFGIAAVFLLLVGGWRRGHANHDRFSRIPWVLGAIVFLAIALPWHLIAGLRTPGFFWFYFINEQVLRALGRRIPHDYTAVPLGLWWGEHVAWFFPWVVFVPLALRGCPRPRQWRMRLSDTDTAKLFVFIWAAFIFLFFSVITGSRMEYYAFSAWPAVALLIGIGLARAEDERSRWLPRLQAALAIVGLLIAALLGTMLWISRDISSSADISALLTRHPTGFYRVAMATFFDLTPDTFAVLRGPAATAALVFLLGFGAAWWLRRRRAGWTANVAVALTMVVFCYAANVAFAAFGPQMSSVPLARAIARVWKPGDQLAVYGEFEAACSVGFYLDRQALIYNGQYNGLAYGSHYPDAPKIFFDDRTWPSVWSRPDTVFLVVPESEQTKARERLPAKATWVLANSGGKTVFMNHPLLPGQPSLADQRAESVVSLPK
ncbi:MAG: glycosyltransferase family 39 protein [Acidobacteriota bacterium]|nr:glycosyltransferase family 39 protein [Acidobacteriota bacterium]